MKKDFKSRGSFSRNDIKFVIKGMLNAMDTDLLEVNKWFEEYSNRYRGLVFFNTGKKMDIMYDEHTFSSSEVYEKLFTDEFMSVAKELKVSDMHMEVLFVVFASAIVNDFAFRGVVTSKVRTYIKDTLRVRISITTLLNTLKTYKSEIMAISVEAGNNPDVKYVPGNSFRKVISEVTSTDSEYSELCNKLGALRRFTSQGRVTTMPLKELGLLILACRTMISVA